MPPPRMSPTMKISSRVGVIALRRPSSLPVDSSAAADSAVCPDIPSTYPRPAANRCRVDFGRMRLSESAGAASRGRGRASTAPNVTAKAAAIVT